MKNDDLGTRMKENYEYRTRTYLPRRTYTLIRVDGKAFHTYTRNCDRPYDTRINEAMDGTAKALVSQIQGAQLAYVQSDEISVLLTDFASNQTDAWFDGNVQKIVSISAAIATAEFNSLYTGPSPMDGRPALFDSRVWTIPDPVEVANYFIWRQQDATRNAVSMAAQAIISHKQLQGKNSGEMQELMFRSGINFNDYPVRFKRGAAVYKRKEYIPVPPIPGRPDTDGQYAVRTRAYVDLDIPIFSQSTFLQDRIPTYEGYRSRTSAEDQEERASVNS